MTLLFIVCQHFTFASTTTFSANPTDGILYVKKGSTGDGSSWSNALGEFSDALREAKTNFDVYEIWVSKGTYYPLHSARRAANYADEGRDNAFALVGGVSVYGHFEGTETSIEGRALTNTANATILSGDLDRDDTFANNAYHVVLSFGANENDIFDGFTVTGGNASDQNSTLNFTGSYEISRGDGGGIYQLSSSLTLKNVNVVQNVAVRNGGGIYNVVSNAIIENTIIKNNQANQGGGFFNIAGSEPIFRNSSIESNTAKQGGGLYNIENSAFTANTLLIKSNTAVEGGGGGIYSTNTSGKRIELENVTIEDNYASLTGGGINLANWTNSIRFARCTIINNEADNNGGGLYISDGVLVVEESNFSANESKARGGAIYGNGTVKISNTIISKNKATNSGGGVECIPCIAQITNSLLFSNISNYGAAATWGGVESDVTITNTTISRNRATTAGGAMYSNSLGDKFKIRNSIIFGNEAILFDNGLHNVGTTPIVHNSLIDGMAAIPANQILEANLFALSDIFKVVAINLENSVATDFHLVDNTDVIDKGINSYFTGPPVNGDLSTAKDLSGKSRLSGTNIDLGAFENSSNRLYVKKGENGTGASWSDAMGELADALLAAQTNSDITEIWVSKGTYYPKFSARDGSDYASEGRDNTFLLVKDVKLYGHFKGTEASVTERELTNPADSTLLSGDIDQNGILDNNNAYHVVVGSGNLGEALMDGFGIIHGYAIGDSYINVNGPIIPRISGAGLHLTSAIEIKNIAIYNNLARTGGGIFISGGDSKFTNIRLTNNIGGGAYITYSVPTFTNAVIQGNRTNPNDAGNFGTNGGGIYSSQGIVAQNCVITGNTAHKLGGGIYFQGLSSKSLTNVTISGNYAGEEGGGVYAAASVLTLQNTVIVGNDAPLNKGLVENAGVTVVKYSFIEGRTDISKGNINGTSKTATDIFEAPLVAGLKLGGNYQLRAGSGLLDRGDNAAYKKVNGTLLSNTDWINENDLASGKRLSGTRIDLGSFEFQDFSCDPSNARLAPNTLTMTQVQAVQGKTYYRHDCEFVAAFDHQSQEMGATEVKVWINTEQQPNYLKRHYQISPATNSTTATGRLTLFFTQEEFNSFNEQSEAPDLLFPTSYLDVDAIANIKLEKRAGTSNSISGAPNTYTGSVETITIQESDIYWNPTFQFWEISLDITGFSGFFLKTSSGALPVQLVHFDARATENKNVLLEWQIADAVNFSHFNVERSTNGTDFDIIGRVSHLVEKNQYSFIDQFISSKEHYYRLQLVDQDQTYAYSRLISVVPDLSIVSQINAYPIPFTNELTLEALTEQFATVINALGIPIQQLSLKQGRTKVSTHDWKPGVYIIRLRDGSHLKVLK